MVSKEDNNHFKNRLNKLIKREKRVYYHNLFTLNRKNIKKTWQVINDLMSKNVNNSTIKKIIYNNIEFTSEAEISNIFNSYFCSVGNNLDADIPSTSLDPLHYISQNNYNNSFWLDPVTNNEVEFHVNNLKNSKQDLNSISIGILKDNASFLSILIARIINVSFESGTFPHVLKKAVVIPLHKKGDRNSVSNFRPISLLHWLSKIFEKCMKARLLNFLNINNIINPVQFGFQSGVSTQDAVLHVIENIYANLNDRLDTVGIFIDFSKCFDTINRFILIKKLEKYGVRGLPLQLFISYLNDRSQVVKIGNTISEAKIIDIGVPQGSVLGPILFLLYVNEIPNIYPNFTSCLFADDTTFLVKGNNLTSCFNSCNEGLAKFSDWCCANRLSVNVSKTNFMIFTNRAYSLNFPLIFNNAPIEQSSSVRFLGVVLDDKLKFNLHINSICSKISKNTGIISKLAYYVPKHVLLQLYHSLIEPYMNYCPLIFGNAYDCHVQPLEVAQRKCVRIISRVDFQFSSNPLFSDLKILKFKDIYLYQLGIYVFKNPQIGQTSQRFHDYNFRNSSAIIPVFQRLSLTQHQSVTFQGPSLWNSIPNSIRNKPSLNAFKFNFKKHLLSQYS